MHKCWGAWIDPKTEFFAKKDQKKSILRSVNKYLGE